MNIIIKIFITVMCIPLLFACFDNNKDNLCPITIDSVKIIDSLSLKNKTYYLIYRVSGWNDKTEVLALYDKKPSFDHCSNSNIKPVFGDSLETNQIVAHIYLIPNQARFEIVYKNGTQNQANINALKLEIR